MEFVLSDNQRFLKNTIRDLAERIIAPVAEEIDRNERYPSEVFGQLAELGYMGIGVPTQYGGSEVDYISVVIIGEELARVSASIPCSLFPHAILCAHNISRNGTEEQKRRFLPSLASGEKIGAVALTEVSAGSDILSMKMKAEKVGDVYVLNGSKTMTTNATIASTFLVYASFNPGQGPEHIAIFIVEKETPGFSVGRKFEKMGMRGSPTAEIFLSDCKVSEANLLGMQQGIGLQQLMSGLDIERVTWSSIGLGITRAAFDASLDYARKREQFGKAIINFQMIQRVLAEMAINLEAVSLLVYRAADLIDQGENARLEASMAKLFSSEVAVKVTGDAVQIHGGCGYTREYPVERYLRDAKVLTIGAGTSEVQCMIIGHELKTRNVLGVQ